MTDERELAAVVAHGLLNTLAVVSGAAFVLGRHADLSEPDRTDVERSLFESAALLVDGLEVVVGHCSEEFRDAARGVMSLAGGVLSLGERPPSSAVLLAFQEHCKVLHEGLIALVRGLPADVVQTLNSISKPGA